MANLREGLEEIQEDVSQEPQIVEEKDFMLTLEEVQFLLAKIANIDFKGVEIEFVYNLIMKLQETYKHLSNDK